MTCPILTVNTPEYFEVELVHPSNLNTSLVAPNGDHFSFPSLFVSSMFQSFEKPLCLKWGSCFRCVVPCGGHNKSPRTSSMVQIIFSFWSFEIRKLLSFYIPFLANVKYIWSHLDYNIFFLLFYYYFSFF